MREGVCAASTRARRRRRRGVPAGYRCQFRARTPRSQSPPRCSASRFSARETESERERDREGEIEKGTDAGQYSARMRVRGHEA